MPLYKEGDRVALKEDNSALVMRAGDVGVVWGRYETQPPCYEVTFVDQNGKPFDMTMREEDLVPAHASPREAIVHSKAA